MMKPFHMTNLHRPGKSVLIFAGVLFFDQLFKAYFRSIGTYYENYGALFGYPVPAPIPSIAFILLVISVTFLISKSRRIDIFLIPFALIFSGILSNSIDRVKEGYVIDYILAGNLFAFNLADLAIACGSAIFIWRIIEE